MSFRINILRELRIHLLAILFLAMLSCRNSTDKDMEGIRNRVDTTELKKENVQKEVSRSNLASFLENPIDLQKYKKSKNRDYTTTSVSSGRAYYFQPNFKDSIFYSYYYQDQNFEDPRRIDQLVLFKYGEHKHSYEDENEILIELRIFYEDLNLGKANLVGMTRTELESDFGIDYLTFGNRVAYTNKNKVLIITLKDSKVESYHYLVLNTEKINCELILQLIGKIDQGE